jgi:hypothetical protein
VLVQCSCPALILIVASAPLLHNHLLRLYAQYVLLGSQAPGEDIHLGVWKPWFPTITAG